jgi:alpha-L-rhamnosidase
VSRAGRADLLPALLRDWGEFLEPMPDGRSYDTIGECWGWGTHAHAWSCTPLKDLVMYVLGVTPSVVGCKVMRVAPRLGDLDRAEGRVPTPYGLVWVRAEPTQVSLDSPVPVDLDRGDGVVERLPAGRHTRSLS